MPAQLLVRPGYSDLIRNTPGLIAYWRMRDLIGTAARNDLTTATATFVGSPLGYQGTPIQDGAGIKFNGTNTALSSAVNLSAYAQVSLSFWMWWDAFANNDKLAFEYTANYNSASGLIVDPNNNSAGGGGVGNFSMGLSTSAALWADGFTRPSAAAWHHYTLCYNRATPLNTAYVDGVLQSLTAGTHTSATYNNFANSTLYFMSRAGASLWGAGRMSEVALYGGVLLTANDARNQYQLGAGW